MKRNSTEDLSYFANSHQEDPQSSSPPSSPEYSLEGLMLKLKLQYLGHMMQRADSLEKTLMLGRLKAGEEGDDRG